MIDNPEFKERIFSLVNGDIDLNRIRIPESEYVCSEFEEGSKCYLAYSDVLDAYERLCERLGLEDTEDDDVEIIIQNLMTITTHLAMKMYDYGVFFARREAIRAKAGLNPPKFLAKQGE